MKRRALFGFVLAVLMLVPFTSAYTELIVHVDETGECLFLGETNENISLPEGVNIENGEIKGTTSICTSKNAETWKFNYSLEGSEMEVFLPEGSVVSETNGELYIDSGDSISKDKIVIYSSDSVYAKYKVSEGQSVLGIWWVLIALLVAVAYFLVRKRFFKKKETSKVESSDTDNETSVEGLKKVLNERENLIVDALKEKGKMKSSVLRRETGIPKAAFFRHVNELEKKGIIKKLGEGRNKIIDLVSD